MDGFNLYYGLKSKGWKRFYWLNLRALVHSLLTPEQHLVRTKYFTARVSAKPSDPAQVKRQNTFIEALETLPEFEIFYGHYLSKSVHCDRCGHRWNTYEEKMTDVNIAAELLTDAFDDRSDTALLLTADSDLTRPIEQILMRFPKKRIVLAFPPNRFSDRLKRTATHHFTVGRNKLAASQFPDEVSKPDGFLLRRPEEWK